jgi:hypothetical protein
VPDGIIGRRPLTLPRRCEVDRRAQLATHSRRPGQRFVQLGDGVCCPRSPLAVELRRQRVHGRLKAIAQRSGVGSPVAGAERVGNGYEYVRRRLAPVRERP